MLKRNKIEYWVFGGFALDGIRGKITRNHEDIDIYLHSTDLDKLIDLFNSENHKFYKREEMYFVESAGLKLEIVILTDEKDMIIANGNHTRVRYPKEMFSKDNDVSIDGFAFRIVPNEVLVLESEFSISKEDKGYGAGLEYDKKLFNKIQTTKIDNMQIWFPPK